MATKTLRIDTGIAEFMLDLPEGINITGAQVVGNVLELKVETDLEVPDNANLVYQNDAFGNSALVAFE